MSLEEIIKGKIDKIWDFSTKFAVVIAIERLKSIFSVMCWVYTLMLLTVNIHKVTESETVNHLLFAMTLFSDLLSMKLVGDD